MVPILRHTNPIHTTHSISLTSILSLSSHLRLGLNYVRLEVLTAVIMKSRIFWDTMPCSPLKASTRFAGAYHFHLQGRISRARNQRESGWQEPHFYAGFLLGLFFDPEDGSDVPPKRWLTFKGLHGTITQKQVFFLGLNCCR
jgi:hypothetical protein